MVKQIPTSSYTPQPLIVLDDGVVRFRENKIVRFLLDAGPFDMNQLAMMPFGQEDYEQFAQLIGYSVSEFGELSYVSPEIVEMVGQQASEIS